MACIGTPEENIRSCHCPAYADLPDEATTGVLFDGVVPTIDVTEKNMNNEFVWAAPLFTMRGTTNMLFLTFQLPFPMMLNEVEMYVFHCPSWGIGVESVVVHNSPIFPGFYRIWEGRGNVTLDRNMENCNSVIRISIPLQNVLGYDTYAIEFTNPSGDPIQWVYVAEMRLSDQPIPTPIPTTTVTGKEYFAAKVVL